MDGPAQRHHLSSKPTPPNYTLKEQQGEKNKINTLLLWRLCCLMRAAEEENLQTSGHKPELCRLDWSQQAGGSRGIRWWSWQSFTKSKLCHFNHAHLLLNDREQQNTHSQSQCTKNQSTVSLSLPKKTGEDWTNNSYQREGEGKQKKWERHKKRSWRLTAHLIVSSYHEIMNLQFHDAFNHLHSHQAPPPPKKTCTAK